MAFCIVIRALFSSFLNVFVVCDFWTALHCPASFSCVLTVCILSFVLCLLLFLCVFAVYILYGFYIVIHPLFASVFCVFAVC